jgi:hypothetical protein
MVCIDRYLSRLRSDDREVGVSDDPPHLGRGASLDRDGCGGIT